MTQRFTRRFRVRQYELDVFGRVSDVTLVRYMQEAAIEASTALGFSPDWYRAQGAIWVVRKLSVRCLAPVTYGDEVLIETWVSGLRGVRSTREYHLSRVRDGARVARGRVEWVYIDTQTAQPTRCPDGWAESLGPITGLEDLGVRLNGPRPTDGAHHYTSRRRVQFHELDAARHVNHAVYLQWTGEAACEACRAAGHVPDPADPQGWTPFQAGHEVQYFAPALAYDNVEVVSWVCEMGEDCWAWTHEVSNADTHKLLARDYSRFTFVDREHKTIALPANVVEDVLRGHQPEA